MVRALPVGTVVVCLYILCTCNAALLSVTLFVDRVQSVNSCGWALCVFIWRESRGLFWDFKVFFLHTFCRILFWCLHFWHFLSNVVVFCKWSAAVSCWSLEIYDKHGTCYYLLNSSGPIKLLPLMQSCQNISYSYCCSAECFIFVFFCCHFCLFVANFWIVRCFCSLHRCRWLILTSRLE